ncbi:hypothetical protein [Arsenophonus sp.]
MRRFMRLSVRLRQPCSAHHQLIGVSSGVNLTYKGKTLWHI